MDKVFVLHSKTLFGNSLIQHQLSLPFVANLAVNSNMYKISFKMTINVWVRLSFKQIL